MDDVRCDPIGLLSNGYFSTLFLERETPPITQQVGVYLRRDHLPSLLFDRESTWSDPCYAASLDRECQALKPFHSYSGADCRSGRENSGYLANQVFDVFVLQVIGVFFLAFA